VERGGKKKKKLLAEMVGQRKAKKKSFFWGEGGERGKLQVVGRRGVRGEERRVVSKKKGKGGRPKSVKKKICLETSYRGGGERGEGEKDSVRRKRGGGGTS